MSRFISLFIFPIFFGMTGVSTANAEDFQVGQSVFLQAVKPKGVPVHRRPAPSFFKHVPDGTTAVIEKIGSPKQWLQIRLSSDETVWVHVKYVRAGGPSSSPRYEKTEQPSIALGGEEAVWADGANCERVLRQNPLTTPQPSSPLRVGTWNLRWFPEGKSPEHPEDFSEPTDLGWLTCVIRWMQVDILAVQEILATPQATQALNTLTDNLTTQSKHPWRWHRQPCGHLDDHHIVLLWNDSRVSLTNFDSLWQFNSKADNEADACTYGLRPGQYARVRSRTADGVDFHLIALHLKSGPTVFDVEERHKALNRLDEAIAPYLNEDRDVVIVGDFNTMGAGDWNSRDYEIKNLRRHLEKEKPGFRDLEPAPRCTHYFRGRGGWLDHILVPHDMREIALNSARVTGYCAVEGCRRIRGDYPVAYRRLSDHCPVIVEIENKDVD